MFFEGFLLKYLDNLFSLEYEGHIKNKKDSSVYQITNAHADTLSILMLSNYKAEIFLKSYYMNDPPPLANEHHVPVHVLYICIFLVYSSSIHYSVDFNRNGLSLVYIF